MPDSETQCARHLGGGLTMNVTFCVRAIEMPQSGKWGTLPESSDTKVSGTLSHAGHSRFCHPPIPCSGSPDFSLARNHHQVYLFDTIRG